MAPVTLAAGLLTYAWPFARDKSSIIVIATLYGYVHSQRLEKRTFNITCLALLTVLTFRPS